MIENFYYNIQNPFNLATNLYCHVNFPFVSIMENALHEAPQI